MLFTYSIVPKGGSDRDALVQRTLYAPNLDAGRRHVQTVKAPDLTGRTDLEVIFTDERGKELWRGAYIGSGD